MTFRSSLLLGVRNFFGKKGQSGVRHLRGAVIGVALSLIPLVVVLVVSDGMIQGITARYIEISTYHLQSVVFADVARDELESYAERISSVEGVTGVYLERQGLGMIAGSGKRSGATIRAVAPDSYDRDPGLSEYLTFREGSFDLSHPGSVLIGEGIAKDLGVGVGDRVTLITMRNIPGRPFVPRLEPFRVTGIFSTGYQELDSLWVYVSLEKGYRILDMSTSQQIIGIKTKDPFRGLSPVLTGVSRILPVDFRTYTWYDLEKSQYKSFQTTRVLLLFIMGLIVCVAAVNISSSLVMQALEKRQEIGILKSLGAGPRGIECSFLITGFIVGVLGTVLGMTIGLLTAININEILHYTELTVNGVSSIMKSIVSPFSPVKESTIRIFNPAFYLETIPVQLDVTALLLIAVFTIALSTFAAFFPARGAGRIRPLDVLRKH